VDATNLRSEVPIGDRVRRDQNREPQPGRLPDGTPPWGRAAGYGWLVVDMATDIMALNGVAKPTFIAMRYGGHLSAALWIALTSLQAKGATRIIGLLLALDLGGYSFVAPFDPTHFVGLLPSFVLLPLWLVLVGRLLHRGDEHQHVSAESGDPAPLVRS
jgi:hypothetical protein